MYKIDGMVDEVAHEYPVDNQRTHDGDHRKREAAVTAPLTQVNTADV